MKTALPEDLKVTPKYLFAVAARVLASPIRRLAPLTYPPVVIAGAARSGTTLLQRMLCELTSGYPIFEPLRLDSDSRLKQILDAPWPRLEPDEEHLELEEFFSDCLRGRHVNHWSLSHGGLLGFLMARRLVVKLIRANRLTGWFRHRFPEAPFVFVVRHPCAIVASMLASPGPWHGWPSSFFREPAEAVSGSTLKVPGPPDAAKAAHYTMFCVHQMMQGLDELGCGSVITLPFEWLVSSPQAVLSSLVDTLSLGEACRARVTSVVSLKPSRTANAGPDWESSSTLTKWQAQLSNTQIDAVLDTSRQIGFDFYDDSPLPLNKAVRDCRTPFVPAPLLR